MFDAVSSLPAWALFALGVIWLTFQFLQKFFERQTKKKEQEALKEYRKKRSSTFPAVLPQPPPVPMDDTGKINLRSVLEEEREREQRNEILFLSRQHAESMAELARAQVQQTQTLERQTRTLERIAVCEERQEKHLEKLTQQLTHTMRYISERPPPGGRIRPAPRQKD